MMRAALPWWCVVLPLLLLGSLACTPQKAPVPPPISTPEPSFSEPTPFAGNAACQPCHSTEFESHSKTFHAATLREATVADLGPLAPVPGPVTGGGTFSVDAGRFVAHTKTSQFPLQVALGSGKTGITFLALLEQTGVEIRQSYFPHEKKWYLTPGLEERSKELGGVIHKEDETRQCLGCHAVTLPVTSLMPEKRFFGVGCESCHGPGAEHIAAMQKGEKPKGLAIVSLRGATGTQLNALCGKCHRTEQDVLAMNASAKKMTNRFQPYGLALSRCFKESDNKLTCVTCHNPHQNAGKESKPYEVACLSCHSGTTKGKTCPVNPKEKCVSCHMPTRSVLQQSTIPIKMADHFIKINASLH